MPVIEQKTTNKNKVDFDLNRLDKSKTTIFSKYPKKNGQGHKPVIPLRFSKSGNLEIEKWYATHFVNTKRIAVLKAQQPVENLA